MRPRPYGVCRRISYVLPSKNTGLDKAVPAIPVTPTLLRSFLLSRSPEIRWDRWQRADTSALESEDLILLATEFRVLP